MILEDKLGLNMEKMPCTATVCVDKDNDVEDDKMVDECIVLYDAKAHHMDGQ